MHTNAYRILNQSLTEAVAKPMVEMQRKNRIAMTGVLLFGAMSILTSMAWIEACGKSDRLGEAWEILAAGFISKAPLYAASPLLMRWELEDGTFLTVNLPSFEDAGSR